MKNMTKYKKAAEINIEHFYKGIRRMKLKNSPVSKLVYVDTTATDDPNICELKSDYFHDLFTNDDESEDSFDNTIYSNITSCVNKYFESDRSLLNPILDCPITLMRYNIRLKLCMLEMH